MAGVRKGRGRDLGLARYQLFWDQSIIVTMTIVPIQRKVKSLWKCYMYTNQSKNWETRENLVLTKEFMR